jgi:hypothetical protein
MLAPGAALTGAGTDPHGGLPRARCLFSLPWQSNRPGETVEHPWCQDPVGDLVAAPGRARMPDPRCSLPPELVYFRSMSYVCEPAVTVYVSPDFSGSAYCGGIRT